MRTFVHTFRDSSRRQLSCLRRTSSIPCYQQPSMTWKLFPLEQSLQVPLEPNIFPLLLLEVFLLKRYLSKSGRYLYGLVRILVINFTEIGTLSDVRYKAHCLLMAQSNQQGLLLPTLLGQPHIRPFRTIGLTCGQTPSTASTTMMHPSQMRTAVDTSEEKSTWPGESIRFIRYSSLPEIKFEDTLSVVRTSKPLPASLERRF